MRRSTRSVWIGLILRVLGGVLLVAIQSTANPQATASDRQVQGDIESLSSKSWQARVSAAQALAKIGSAAIQSVPALLQSTQDRYSGVREAAASALGEVVRGSTGKVVSDTVSGLLGRCDDRPEVRSAARAAILRIGTGAAPAMVDVLRSNAEITSRRFAAELLAEADGFTVGLAADAAFLLNDLDNDVKSRSAAAISRAVEQCALLGSACLPQLSAIRVLSKAFATASDPSLRQYELPVDVCLRYLEFMAPVAAKTKYQSIIEAAARYTTMVCFVALLGVAVIFIWAHRSSKTKTESIKELEREIREIREQKTLQEQNEIARSVLKRFVTMPDRQQRPGFTIAAAFKDATAVSGDFYNWFNRSDGSVCIYLVDVEGSGIDAAIQATHAAKVLERTLTRGDIQKAPALLENADHHMLQELGQPNIAVTMNLVEIYPNLVRLANAGMPPPLLFRHGQAQPQQLQAAGVYVGGGYGRFRVEPRSFETQVNEGDLLILFSDGVLEARDSVGGLFGRPGIESAVARARDSEPGTIAKNILSAAAEHSGDPLPADDQTVVVVRFGGYSPSRAGAQTLIEVSSDESEADFTITNAADCAAVCDSELQAAVRGWVGKSAGYSPGRIWCAIWEALKNAVPHGSNRGEVILLKLRRSRDLIVVEVEQPTEWRNWDEFLGEAAKKRLPDGAPRTAADIGGTVALLKLADTVTASMLGRRLTLVFKRAAAPNEGGITTHD